jgi:transcriptional regulator with XRE-family HTH domain
MTARHMLEGLMQWTRARDLAHCAVLLGIDISLVSRISSGERRGLHISTVDLIQQKTGVPFDMLFDWYRLPDEAVLGRISKAK